jgi:uncharacterized membrane protein
VNARLATRWTYLALIALQPAWHALLPPPAGSGSWILAAIATVPLLLPLRGVWAGSLRAMTWAGYLSMLYLVVGVMEAWANPPQRPAALLQIALVAALIAGIFTFSRRARRPAG